VPDDAALVVVLGPERPFLPEEAASLASYVERGGALALFLDPSRPGTDDIDVALSLQPVLQGLGVSSPAGEVMNDKEYVKQSGTAADHVFVFSTSFGTHKAVKTLNGARGKAALLFLSARAVKKTEAATSPKVSFIARSRPATFLDDNGNRRHDDPAEKRDIVDFAAAIEKKLDGDREARALVVGDSDVVADTLLQNEANAVLEGVEDASQVGYGGNDEKWSCGTLRYVRVEFAGFSLDRNKELTEQLRAFGLQFERSEKRTRAAR